MAVTGVYRSFVLFVGKRAARRAGILALCNMLAVLAAAASLPAWGGQQNRVLFVASQRAEPYTEFVSLTRQALGADNPSGVSGDILFADDRLETHVSAAESPYDIIVAMGTRAAHALQQLQPETPIVYTLIPEITFDELKRSGRLTCHENRCTAVYIDQPLERQIRVLHAAFGHRRVGVLFGPASRRYQPPLEEVMERYGLPGTTAMVDSDDKLLSALQTLLEEVDVLLAVPDPLVYNSGTAQRILLTTYRYKVPLVAFSKAYIDAGATLSVYSTPAQMANQAAKIISDFMKSDRKHLPAPDYPERYKVLVNHHVAGSIDLDFEDNPEFLSILEENNNE